MWPKENGKSKTHFDHRGVKRKLEELKWTLFSQEVYDDRLLKIIDSVDDYISAKK